MTLVEREPALRAFTQGFVVGSDPCRARKGHNVEPATHEHWRRGFEAGRVAQSKAADEYRAQLEAA